MRFKKGDWIQSKYTGNVWEVLFMNDSLVNCKLVYSVVPCKYLKGYVVEFHNTAFSLFKEGAGVNHPHTDLFK